MVSGLCGVFWATQMFRSTRSSFLSQSKHDWNVSQCSVVLGAHVQQVMNFNHFSINFQSLLNLFHNMNHLDPCSRFSQQSFGEAAACDYQEQLCSIGVLRQALPLADPASAQLQVWSSWDAKPSHGWMGPVSLWMHWFGGRPMSIAISFTGLAGLTMFPALARHWESLSQVWSTRWSRRLVTTANIKLHHTAPTSKARKFPGFPNPKLIQWSQLIRTEVAEDWDGEPRRWSLRILRKWSPSWKTASSHWSGAQTLLWLTDTNGILYVFRIYPSLSLYVYICTFMYVCI